MELEQYFSEQQAAMEQCLRNCLPPLDDEVKSLYDSVSYSLFSEGKRIRPILMMAVYESVTHSNSSCLTNPYLSITGCAIEIVHTSSLILDDLPAMDNARERRGQKTNHIVYGEAIALLAADTLQTYAFELLAREIPGRLGLELIRELGKSIGTRGMIGGQLVDLQNRGKPVDYDTLMYIHRKKSGALFEFAAKAGALIGKAAPKEVELIAEYASLIGLAYQISDDILDYETEGLTNGEVNFVTVMGLDPAQQKMNDFLDLAIQKIEFLSSRASRLHQIADFVKKRVVV